MATLKDVANEVGVSVATVSYVLNETGSVSKKVQEKVHKAVSKLAYKPNRKAQAMRTGVSKTIGLILPDLTNPFFPKLVQQIECEARKHEYAVVLIDSQNMLESEEQGFSVLAQHGTDGIIWCPVTDTPSKYIRETKCPVIVVDRAIPGFDVVHSDFKLGGSLLAEYVNRLGHTRIGMLSGPQSVASAKQRRQGFIDNISENAKILWDIEVAFDINLTSKVENILKDNKATLIVCADDVIAIGLINRLDSMGISVPADVSVVGFDNISWSRIIKPKLTTINQPVEEMAKYAVKLLIEKIHNPDSMIKSIVLEVNLIERDSVQQHV